MKVSQLLKVMDKTDWVTIFDAKKSIKENLIYEGKVQGVKKDNTVNGYHVSKVFAYDDIVIMEAVKPSKKGGAK